MARRSTHSFAKRQKEVKRLEKKKEKAERKARRRAEDGDAPPGTEDAPAALQETPEDAG